jgi:hypothetical protein
LFNRKPRGRFRKKIASHPPPTTQNTHPPNFTQSKLAHLTQTQF